MLRYASKDGTVRFDDFIACAVKLKTMFGKKFLLSRHSSVQIFYFSDIYNERDPRHTGEAKFDLDAVRFSIDVS